MIEKIILKEVYPIERHSFSSAGNVSSKIKKQLKKLGLDSKLIRKVAVSSYEVELNIVIHSLGGNIFFDISPTEILLIAKDLGPGIENVELAMQEGFSTATEDIRGLGFGAGMGLPNMTKNCDEFSIKSSKETGTEITMRFFV